MRLASTNTPTTIPEALSRLDGALESLADLFAALNPPPSVAHAEAPATRPRNFRDKTARAIEHAAAEIEQIVFRLQAGGHE